jgi:hypothetical protein
MMELHNDFFLNPAPNCRKIEEMLQEEKRTAFHVEQCRFPHKQIFGHAVIIYGRFKGSFERKLTSQGLLICEN